MNHYPDAYQDWLFDALSLSKGSETDPRLIEPLYGLNKQWVHTSEVMEYDDEVMRAYTLYYMTINMPKLWHVLNHAHPLRHDRIESVVEFGCGPGTFLWSYLFYLRSTDPPGLASLTSVRGIDRSPVALSYAERFAKVLKRQPEFSHLSFSFDNCDWKTCLDAPADFAIFGNVLNEGHELPTMTGSLPFGAVAIIEPGTSKVFPTLVDMRNRLTSGGYAVAFPCPTWSEECPMTGTENWCHFAINRFSLPFIQRMSNHAKRLNPRHNFCGFLFERDSAWSEEPDTWRCVSRLRKAKRSGIRWLCNGCRLEEVVLGRHARSESNRPFLEAEHGQRVAISPPLSGNRLTPESSVEIVDAP